MSKLKSQVSENTTNSFGFNLRSLIKSRRLSFVSAADEFGISVSFLHQLMRGERDPSMETVKDICSYFGVEKSTLLDGNEKEFAISLAKQTAAKGKLKSNRRLEFLAWELDLDPQVPEERQKLESILPVLHSLKNIPPELLSLLSKQDALYFESLQRTLTRLGEKTAKATPPRRRQG